MLVFVLPIEAFAVAIQVYLHFGNVMKVEFTEKRVACRGSFKVALLALLVGKGGTPVNELGSGASTLMGGMRVEDVENCAEEEVG